MTDNKRRFTRIPFDAMTHIVSSDGSWHGQLLDVSLKGALTTVPENWEGKPGEHFLLEFKLENSDINIRMETEVAHCEENHVGFVCVNIDLDSITHLRKLVELNLGDPELLDRELSALGT